ncbi:hypothetical protein ZWY2020_047087 [Hordeum vulgare]|nr:hypothetical protein ZWY2020_047087 [Hordeum vulgare]
MGSQRRTCSGRSALEGEGRKEGAAKLRGRILYPAAPYRTCTAAPTGSSPVRRSKILLPPTAPFRSDVGGRQAGIPGVNCSCRAAACAGQPGKPNATLGSIRCAGV